jgi:hypothetical protein
LLQVLPAEPIQSAPAAAILGDAELPVGLAELAAVALEAVARDDVVGENGS